MSTLRLDLTYAIRVLARDRGFALVAIATLGLAIGGVVTLLSVVDALLLRGLPVAEPFRMVRVHAVASRTGALGPLSYPDATDLRRGTSAFDLAAVHRVTGISVSADRRPARATAELVSGEYLALLDATAARGRVLGPADDRAPLQHPVVVLADGFWRRYFGAAEDVVGSMLTVNGRAFTVVGVAAPEFRGASDLVVPDLWVPVLMQAWVMPRAVDVLNDRDTQVFELTGRLRPEVSRAAAEAVVQAAAAHLDRDYPRRAGTAVEARRVHVAAATRVPASLQAPVAGFTGLLAAVVSLVLVLTGLNLANLLLARATTRARELGVRSALGAPRGRLVRQLLTEQLVLSSAGGLAGLGLAYALQRVLSSIPAPTPVPVTLDLRLDLRLVGACLAVSSLTGLAYSLAPALRAARGAVAPALRGVADGGRRRLRWIALVAQIAGSLVLLATAGLLLSSLQRMTSASPGFDVSPVTLAAMNVGLQGYDEARGTMFFDTLQERLSSAPGMEAVSFGWTVPMGSAALAAPVTGGAASRSGEPMPADYNFVAPGYFDVLGIPVRAGRAILRIDGPTNTRVVVVNDALAARLWPGQDPVGQHLRLIARGSGRDSAALGLSVAADTDVEVIGVAATVALRAIGEAPRPAFYLPFAQWYQTERTVHVRAVDAAAAAATIRQAVARLDAELPLFNERTMSQHLARSYLPARLAGTAVGLFGVLTLALATIGLYGLVSVMARSRTKEMAVRLAIGGTSGDVVRLIAWDGMRPVLWGLVLGLGLAVAAASALRPFLFDAAIADVRAWTVAVALLLAAAFGGAVIPARRVSTLDAAPILRQTE